MKSVTDAENIDAEFVRTEKIVLVASSGQGLPWLFRYAVPADEPLSAAFNVSSQGEWRDIDGRHRLANNVAYKATRGDDSLAEHSRLEGSVNGGPAAPSPKETQSDGKVVSKILHYHAAHCSCCRCRVMALCARLRIHTYEYMSVNTQDICVWIYMYRHMCFSNT